MYASLIASGASLTLVTAICTVGLAENPPVVVSVARTRSALVSVGAAGRWAWSLVGVQVITPVAASMLIPTGAMSSAYDGVPAVLLTVQV